MRSDVGGCSFSPCLPSGPIPVSSQSPAESKLLGASQSPEKRGWRLKTKTRNRKENVEPFQIGQPVRTDHEDDFGFRQAVQFLDSGLSSSSRRRSGKCWAGRFHRPRWRRRHCVSRGWRHPSLETHRDSPGLLLEDEWHVSAPYRDQHKRSGQRVVEEREAVPCRTTWPPEY